MIVYIENGIAKRFTSDSIIKEFDKNDRRVPLVLFVYYATILHNILCGKMKFFKVVLCGKVNFLFCMAMQIRTILGCFRMCRYLVIL